MGGCLRPAERAPRKLTQGGDAFFEEGRWQRKLAPRQPDLLSFSAA